MVSAWLKGLRKLGFAEGGKVRDGAMESWGLEGAGATSGFRGRGLHNAPAVTGGPWMMDGVEVENLRCMDSTYPARETIFGLIMTYRLDICSWLADRPVGNPANQPFGIALSTSRWLSCG